MSVETVLTVRRYRGKTLLGLTLYERVPVQRVGCYYVVLSP